jgi:dihydroxyacetone kinase-like predicted kinase
MVEEGRLLKLHIHTNNPEEILAYLERMGTLEMRKIDDMKTQSSLISSDNHENEVCSLVVFVPGPGFIPVFNEMGAEYCYQYGLHLPSAGEIGEFIAKIPDDHLIILPNNNNILPAVMMVKEHSDKVISILSTGNVIEGLSAVYGFSGDGTVMKNIDCMRECQALCEGLFVYRSSGDSRYGGTDIHKDDYFVLCSGQLIFTGDKLASTVLEALKISGIREKTNVTFFTGETVHRESVGEIVSSLKSLNPDLETEIRSGGQPRETLIIALE